MAIGYSSSGGASGLSKVHHRRASLGAFFKRGHTEREARGVRNEDDEEMDGEGETKGMGN